MILISSERFAEHQTPPGHPERPERAGVMNAVAARYRAGGGEVVAPREATHEQLARVHDAPYLQRLEPRPTQRAPSWRAINYERAVSIRSRFFLEDQRKSL